MDGRRPIAGSRDGARTRSSMPPGGPIGVGGPVYTPWTETDCIAWYDADHETVTAALATVTDRSSGGHDLTNPTTGERMAVTANVVNGHQAFVPGATTAHSGYLAGDWNKPTSAMLYFLIKYNVGTTYQVAFVGNVGAGAALGPVGRFSHNAGNLNKASLASGANVIYTAAMADDEIHVVTYGWNTTTMYLRLDDGSVASAALDQSSHGIFRDFMGFPTLDTQDNITPIAKSGIFNTLGFGADRDLRVLDYLMTAGGLA